MKEGRFKKLFFLFLIVLILISSIVAAFVFLGSDSIEERILNKQMINILFTVHDKGELILQEAFFYNPETKKSVILYIPAETWLLLEKLNRYDRIKVLYKPGWPQDLKDKLERLIDVKLAYTIDLELENFAKLVDLLGGINFFIPQTIQQRTEKDLFLFESGSVLLDGDKACKYLLLKLEEENELERAQAQQDILKSLFTALIENMEKGFLTKDKVLDLILSFLKTNLSRLELKSLFQELVNMKLENILYRKVHGSLKKQENERIFFPNDQGQQLRQTVSASLEYLRDSSDLRPEDLIVKLEVLNGTEIPYRARNTANIYRRYGYEVVREDNAPKKPVEHTLIVDYRGNTKTAQDIAKIIKCKRIETQIDERSIVDITIILGLDFDGQYCK